MKSTEEVPRSHYKGHLSKDPDLFEVSLTIVDERLFISLDILETERRWGRGEKETEKRSLVLL